MNANVSKTNGVKLLAAVAVLAMIVCAFAAVMPAEQTDAAPSGSNITTELGGGITPNDDGTTYVVQSYMSGNVVVLSNFVIPNTTALVIGGDTKFTVNEGVTITIQAGGQLVFTDNADVTINGNIVAEGTDPESTTSNGVVTKGTGYQAAIVNNVNAVDDGTTKCGVVLNGTITLEEGAEMIAITGNIGVPSAQGATGTGVGTGVTITDGTAGGEIELSEGALIEVTKRSSRISVIEDQTIILNTGATFTMNGHANGIKVQADGTATYYVAGAAGINTSEDNEYTNTGRTTSNLTFTVTTETTPALLANDDDAQRITLRSYVLNIDGDVAAGDVLSTEAGKKYSDGSSTATFYDVNKGEFNTETNQDRRNTYEPMASVTGTLSVEADSGFEVNGELTVSGTVTLKSETENNVTDGVDITINDKLYVSGTFDVDAGTLVPTMFETNGRVYVEGGLVTISGTNDNLGALITAIENPINLPIYGTVYIVEDTSTTSTIKISDFDDALADAVANEVEDIYVFSYGSQNRTTAEGAVYNGAYEITTDMTIPEDMTVYIVNAMVVAEGATLTIADGGIVELYSNTEVTSTQTPREANSKLFVEGSVVDYGGAMEEYEEYSVGKFFYEVKKEAADRSYVTYTTLKLALAEAVDGEVININGPLKITENLEIPANVTVVTDADITSGTAQDAITIEGATLTVNGILEMHTNNSGAVDATVTLCDNDDGRKASIVVNNIIANVATNQPFMYVDATGASTAYTVAGAQFTGTIGDYEDVAFVTSVAVAADASSTVENGITINGTVSAGDVAFTQGEDVSGYLVITVSDAAELSVGTITMNGGQLIVRGELTGAVSAPVTAGTTTMTFDEAKGITFTVVPFDDGASVTTSVQISGVSDIVDGSDRMTLTGTTSVDAGVVTLKKALVADGITVAEGAELVIDDAATLYVNSDFSKAFEDLNITVANNDMSTIMAALMDVMPNVDISALIADNSALIIDGTVTVKDNGIITWGPVVVNGALVTEENSTMTVSILDVSGTVTIGENTAVVDAENDVNIEVLMIEGAITGAFTMNEAYVYPSADITGAVMNPNANNESQAVSTQVYVNGDLALTLYAERNNSFDISNAFLGIDLTGLRYDTYAVYSDESMTNKLFAYSDQTKRSVNVGQFESVYISMSAALVRGTVSEGTGLNLFIDNVAFYPVQNEGQPGTNYSLTVGTHTVRFDVTSGYDASNAVITFNGQTVENGGTITVTVDMIQNGFTLAASGAVPAQSTVVIDDGNGGSNMGLTDYLLIILVILIVVMAIMVAMRLMRS